MKQLQKISYSQLNSRQRETYNFQKVSAILADYCFVTLKLNDDWQGADFIAQHIDGKSFYKVQLKSRLGFNKKYRGKNIHICFPHKGDWYLIDHDLLLDIFLNEFKDTMAKSPSWGKGGYTWPTISASKLKLIEPYKI